MSLRLAVLASGRGSNFEALLEACRDGRIDGDIVGLCSDKPDCGAVATAREACVAVWAQTPKAFASRDAFDASLFDALAAVQPDLIVCAGYMRIIGTAAIARFPHRMINIHPSLLPRHPGLHTHQRALDAGDTEHGASVHVVIPELDAGPLLAQVRFPIEPDDTAATLAERLLPREHALLTATVAALSHRTLNLDPLRWQDQPLRAPLQLNASDTLEAVCA